ncbi:MAG: hypothetical protein FWG02_11315, partial [Holophagaceae bacterium]|nr:hypothetical protein [Holophagaceae bacterium]
FADFEVGAAYSGQAVVRIRTVRYGEGDNMVNFNETPYKQALPATWTETITCRIDFSAPEIDSPPPPPVWDGSIVINFSNSTPTVNLLDTMTKSVKSVSVFASAPTASKASGNGLMTDFTTYNWTVDASGSTPTGLVDTTDYTIVNLGTATAPNATFTFVNPTIFGDGDSIKIEAKANGSPVATTPVVVTMAIEDVTAATVLESMATTVPISVGTLTSGGADEEIFAAAITFTTTLPSSSIDATAFTHLGTEYEIEWDVEATTHSMTEDPLKSKLDVTNPLRPKIELDSDDTWATTDTITLSAVIKRVGGATSLKKIFTITFVS